MTKEQFGRYRLLARIAMGGMGEVFLARHRGAEGTDRLVVVKRILPNLARDPDFVAYFVHEGRLASLFNHPNVVQTFELGQIDGRYFIVMEYVPGPTLVRLLARAVDHGNRLSVPLALHLAIDIARGLDYVHRRCDLRGRPLQIVHMDLAPHNILVNSEAQAKLLDFGIAQAKGLGRRYRPDFRGRSAYLAPEQIDGLEIDQRVDVFALGVIMHEMLACRPLFRARTESMTVTRILHARIPPPHKMREDCPPRLGEVILGALARDREQRYQTAGELLADLDECALSHQLTRTSAALRAEMRELIGAAAPLPARQPASAAAASAEMWALQPTEP